MYRSDSCRDRDCFAPAGGLKYKETNYNYMTPAIPIAIVFAIIKNLISMSV